MTREMVILGLTNGRRDTYLDCVESYGESNLIIVFRKVILKEHGEQDLSLYEELREAYWIWEGLKMGVDIPSSELEH